MDKAIEHIESIKVDMISNLADEMLATAEECNES